MAINDFLPIATEGTPNVESQVDYAGSTEQQQGFAVGQIPPSATFNKMLRQASSIAALIAAFIVEATGQDMEDNEDITGKIPLLSQAIGATGQCRLSVASATSLKLSPFNGSLININGSIQQIPSGGITIANSGLTGNTLYYVYVYMNSGVMTLELSATPHATNSFGIEVKTGDATRSLVGMIYTSNNTPGQFVDGTTQRFCANWYNRRPQYAMNSGSSTLGTGTATTDVTPSNHAQILSWSSEVAASACGSLAGNGLNGLIDMGVGIDGTASTSQISVNVFTTTNFIPYAVNEYNLPVAEGLHYSTSVGSTDINSNSQFSSARSTITAFI